MAGILASALLAAGPAPAQRRADAPGTGGGTGGDAVRAGAEAWQAGDHARAVALWRPLAVAGNAYAQYDLGQAYRLGQGVPADQQAARDWYRKAALQDHPQALASYGLLLFQAGDRAGALPWLRKAADRGDPRAQYVVGTALFNGDIAPKDWVRAYALMTRAAAARLPPAVTSLAEMDRFIPLGQRAQGTALARDLARSAALAADDQPAAAPPPPSTSRPAPPPVRAAADGTSPVKTAASVPRPISPVTPQPLPVAGAQGGWRVQVGAYGDAAAAQKAWGGLAASAPGLRPYLVKAGAVTRLQAGPLASRAEANRACARISAAGAACFPVQAQ